METPRDVAEALADYLGAGEIRSSDIGEFYRAYSPANDPGLVRRRADAIKAPRRLHF